MTRPFATVLLRRAARIGERRSERLAESMCREIGLMFPDISVLRERGQVRLAGRGLRRRWITNASLRWIGRLL